MIPTPPTRRDMNAIPTRNTCTIPSIPLKLAINCSAVATVKSSSPILTRWSLRRASSIFSATSAGIKPALVSTNISDNSSSSIPNRSRAVSKGTVTFVSCTGLPVFFVIAITSRFLSLTVIFSPLLISLSNRLLPVSIATLALYFSDSFGYLPSSSIK